MKFLVISDTHGKLLYAQRAIETLKERISGVIHLGDMTADAKALEQTYALPFHYVAGNCDFYFSAADDLLSVKTIEINGVSILLTHGHADGVKGGYLHLAANAKKTGSRVALCGHTHEPYNNIVDGVLIVNPGSISFPRGRSRFPSYAVIDISDDSEARAGIVEMR